MLLPSLPWAWTVSLRSLFLLFLILIQISCACLQFHTSLKAWLDGYCLITMQNISEEAFIWAVSLTYFSGFVTCTWSDCKVCALERAFKSWRSVSLIRIRVACLSAPISVYVDLQHLLREALMSNNKLLLLYIYIYIYMIILLHITCIKPCLCIIALTMTLLLWKCGIIWIPAVWKFNEISHWQTLLSRCSHKCKLHGL